MTLGHQAKAATHIPSLVTFLVPGPIFIVFSLLHHSCLRQILLGPLFRLEEEVGGTPYVTGSPALFPFFPSSTSFPFSTPHTNPSALTPRPSPRITAGAPRWQIMGCLPPLRSLFFPFWRPHTSNATHLVAVPPFPPSSQGTYLTSPPHRQIPIQGGGSAPRARCTRATHYFYSSYTQNGLAFTASQNAPQGEQTLGYKTCVNIPPSCPIWPLPR